ncbi:hypothetical protein I312_105562 [Cryptococcus bacillisporus CA1280]|uniref:uncharacterized protein n=1 Tax=Cryptococcus bacillisporus CA1280 TaxID=1296109 RepID=UPI0033681F0D
MDSVAGVLQYMTVLERLKNQSGSTPSSFPSMALSSSPPLLRNYNSAVKASPPILPQFSRNEGVLRPQGRPKSSVNQLVENILQLHMLHSRRLETRFYAAALHERTRMSFFNKSAEPFPMMLPRAQIDKDYEPSAISINPNPLPLTPSQYIPTLSGLIAAVDAAVKVANKASVYCLSGKMQIANPFTGGLLTGV